MAFKSTGSPGRPKEQASDFFRLRTADSDDADAADAGRCGNGRNRVFDPQDICADRDYSFLPGMMMILR
jgi:hypothetical protein